MPLSIMNVASGFTGLPIRHDAHCPSTQIDCLDWQLSLELIVNTHISIEYLMSLIGTPNAPCIVDVRIVDDIAEIPYLIPSSTQRRHDTVAEWAHEFQGKEVVISCHKGLKLSEGVAALLRLRGIEASVLIGGAVAWRDAKLPAVPLASLSPRIEGKTRWVTRSRPKIDRIACPWLIRRFVDPSAEFLFVEASQVQGVAERFDATPFDVDGVYWSHRGETCTFDTMIEGLGLDSPALQTVATIVRGADTASLDLAPQAAGLLAISLGLSRLYTNDLEQLNAGMLVYDALYAWARDGQSETHNWPAGKPAT
jgi:rhodanese-related sulfurtransferase